MRNLLSIVSGLSLLAACGSSPAEIKTPPVLKVTSPQRSLVQAAAGTLTVTGTVGPSESGAAVKSVEVNNVTATVAADGSFTANVQVKAGASLIHTVARDADGGEATDTRSVQAGELRAMTSQVDQAMTAAISPEAFAAIGKAAGNLIKTNDFSTMLAPMNPMLDVGTTNGQPDCLYAQADILDLKMTDAKISMVPVQGGLDFTAEIDGLNVPAHTNYAVACINGSTDLTVTATSVIVHGTLLVSPDGAGSFKTDLANQDVQVTGFHLEASGLPGEVINMLSLDTAIGWVISKGATMFMGPMMNKALGALAGPKTVALMGHQVTFNVTPSDISFDPTGGLVILNTQMSIAGSESAPGYVFVDNGFPTINAGQGFQIGLANNAANQLLAGVNAVGMINLSMAASGGTFDATAIKTTVAPMLATDPADGKMRIIVGDMMMDFKLGEKVQARAAVNVKVDLKVTSVGNGYGIALDLDKPQIFIDVLDDVANTTHYTPGDLSNIVTAAVQSQVDSMSKLLTQIPLPAIGGVQLRNLTIDSDSGYVMMGGTLQ
jgi:hypothetical protein